MTAQNALSLLPTSKHTLQPTIVQKQTFSTPKRVTLCSAFRDSVRNDQLDRYLDQVWELHEYLAARCEILHCVWGEGDSTDGTRARLQKAANAWGKRQGARGKNGVTDCPAPFPPAPCPLIVDCAHGGPAYGSVEDEQRFHQLAYVGNQIWAAIPEETDVVIYVESDLIWSAPTLIGLLDATAIWPAVAPMVLDSPPANTFYDVWAYRRNGVRFTKQPPYHPEISSKPLQLDSAGSCLALRWQVAQWLHFPEDCFVGFCRLLYERESSLWLLPNLTVYHP